MKPTCTGEERASLTGHYPIRQLRAASDCLMDSACICEPDGNAQDVAHQRAQALR